MTTTRAAAPGSMQPSVATPRSWTPSAAPRAQAAGPAFSHSGAWTRPQPSRPSWPHPAGRPAPPRRMRAASTRRARGCGPAAGRWRCAGHPARRPSASCRRAPPCAWHRARCERRKAHDGRLPSWRPALACQRQHTDRRRHAARRAARPRRSTTTAPAWPELPAARASCETSFRWFLSLLARHLHVHMQAKGTATSAHAFNRLWDIASSRVPHVTAY